MPDRGSSWWISWSDGVLPSEAAIETTTLLWNPERDTWDLEHGADSVDDRLEQVLDRSLRHQELGQLEKAVSLDGSPAGLGTCGLEAGDDPCHRRASQSRHTSQGYPVT